MPVFFVVSLIAGPVAFAITRHFSGWRRWVLAFGLLLVMVLPFILAGPEIRQANHHSPDAGGYIVVGLAVVGLIHLISALSGFVVGGIVRWREKRKNKAPPEAVF